MAMFAKCQGVATLAIALVLAGADRARGQGFRVLPNQPFVNNAAFFMNPGLAQARFLSGLQGQAVVNSLSNPFGPGGLGAAALANPYTSGAIGSASLANPYVPAGANYGSAYSPYGYPPYYSDPLMGAADVLRSYGDVVNAQEKARILREAAKQSRLETAKKRFDTERYIQDNTPTFTEEQAKVTAQVLKRLQSTSNPFEIHSGASLNIMLDDLKKNMSKRVVLGAINLPDNVLLHINVTTGPGNLGLLRHGGR